MVEPKPRGKSGGRDANRDRRQRLTRLAAELDRLRAELQATQSEIARVSVQGDSLHMTQQARTRLRDHRLTSEKLRLELQRLWAEFVSLRSPRSDPAEN